MKSIVGTQLRAHSKALILRDDYTERKTALGGRLLSMESECACSACQQCLTQGLG